MKEKEPVQIYQIKITLDDIRPPIWRRMLLSSNTSLLELHTIIQAVFGWLDYHLHVFKVNGIEYSDPAVEDFGELNFEDETKVKLGKLGLREKSKFSYQYDFGDSWDHSLLVEKILPFEKGVKLPRCIAGKRSRPPEDVGGRGGYADFLDAIRDPENEEHDSYLVWAGGAYDPEAFNLEAANAELRQRTQRNWIGDQALDNPIIDLTTIFDPSHPSLLTGGEHEETAQNLPLRKDLIAFLTYLQENKVTGTQSTGNLPLKVVEDLAARFTISPQLETGVGEFVLRFRCEEEVWPIYFVHVLAKGADLISGGPGRRWRLTSGGETFLTLPPESQVRFLFAAWWQRINWLVVYPITGSMEYLPEQFAKSILLLLKALSVDHPILFSDFVEQVIQEIGWMWRNQAPNSMRSIVSGEIEQMVIDPLEGFGILLTVREKDTEWLWDVQKLVTFSLTSFGLALLDTLQEASS